MDTTNLLIGILLVIGAIAFTINEINDYNKSRKFDWMIYSSNVKIYTGVVIALMIGLVMIYREIEFLFI